MIKIIGGKYRSRVIVTPDSRTVPTKNMVREALFSAVSFDLDGNTLDLFAGSGAVGIEALSRGAKKSYFVDTSNDAIKVIKFNLASLKEGNGIILDMDYLAALEHLYKLGISFSFIYIDPPYKDKEYYQNSIDMINKLSLLDNTGRIGIEYEGELELNLEGFSEVKYKKYGYTKLILLRK